VAGERLTRRGRFRHPNAVAGMTGEDPTTLQTPDMVAEKIVELACQVIRRPARCY